MTYMDSHEIWYTHFPVRMICVVTPYLSQPPCQFKMCPVLWFCCSLVLPKHKLVLGADNRGNGGWFLHVPYRVLENHSTSQKAKARCSASVQRLGKYLEGVRSSLREKTQRTHPLLKRKRRKMLESENISLAEVAEIVRKLINVRAVGGGNLSGWCLSCDWEDSSVSHCI